MFSVSKKPTIKEIQDLYATEKAVPSQVFQFFLNRSKLIDKKIHAVQTFTEERGQQEADNCDKLLEEYKEKHGKNWFEKLIKDYPLFGIPYSIKAIIQAEGVEFRASSKVLEGFIAPYSSTVYNKIHASGAILIAVNHMDEFAMGASGENSAYGPTKNPYALDRVPGGSSSGVAAAVASGQVVFALGSDTGGSIRQPSAFCGVVGLKTTYGLVSRYGVMPMASSFDQVGPITNTVRDNALVLSVLAGKDTNDQTTIDSTDLIQRVHSFIYDKPARPVKKITKTTKPLTIGIPKEFYIEGTDEQIAQAMAEIRVKLESLGHTTKEISLPAVSQAVATYYMTMSVEVASNLERYDGVRYRGSNAIPEKEEMFFDYRNAYFGDEAKRRIILGTYASSAGYYDAYYNRASKVKEKARREFEAAFTEVDVMLTPTTPEFAFKIGSKSNDPLKMYLSDIFTAVVNPVRIPGLVVPLGLFEVPTDNNEEGEPSEISVDGDALEIGQSKSVRLPTGAQILGPEKSEDVLLALGEEIENLVANS